MFRVRHIAIVISAAFLITLFGAGPVTAPLNTAAFIGPGDAFAQQAKKKKRRSLFSILFGRKKAKKKAVSNKRKRSARSKKSRASKKTASAATAAAKVKAVEKREDAKVILVVGDFFASGLADGLTAALAQVPTLRVVDKSKGLSGFVRNDIVDWSVDLPPLVAEHKPSYIVAMLGSNDRQQIRKDGKRLKKQSPQWLEAYGERVNSLGKSLKATGVRYAWVGLPPVRFKNMNKDFLVFNEIYGKAAESRQGQFIDVWDGFSDADGNYSRSGPDVNGQIVLLRAKDGINLTRAGKRRLSYYVEGIVQKLFGGDVSGAVGLAGIGIDVEAYTVRSPQYDPAKSGKTFIVRLDDPAADGGETLAGETVEVSSGLAQSLSELPNSDSALAGNPTGRVDNFAWPPRDMPAVKPIAVAAPKPVTVPLLRQSNAATGAASGTSATQ